MEKESSTISRSSDIETSFDFLFIFHVTFPMFGDVLNKSACVSDSTVALHGIVPATSENELSASFRFEQHLQFRTVRSRSYKFLRRGNTFCSLRRFDRFLLDETFT